MARQYRWLTQQIVLAAHARSLKDHGGASGIRDEGMLISALERAGNLYNYGEPSIFELAAAYVFAFVKNHPFVDGNKRTGFLAGYVFLGMNGVELVADEDEAAAIILDLAAGEVAEAELARWLAAACAPAADG